MSGAPNCSGNIQFAKPTKAGMIAPKIITMPCKVVSWLKRSGSKICKPGWNNSARMSSAMMPPEINIAKLNHMYIEPMSLWLVVVT